jgi:hypothetical protein
LERVLASPRQVGGTDVEPELHGGAIHAPYWADRTGLEGMGLAVQRMKRVALEHCGGASFGEPVVRLIGGDEAHGPELTLVCLDIVLPEDVDRDQFRDGFFASIAEELSDDDSTRLAVNVIGEA